ncbi:hypothetical protein P378_11045 [Desulforamulus profundi]|uniref:DUF2933 domain-containing protein n=1 Tax=Desulforamulus profundi TaxID=1383067 RepID=A0A2C6LIM4_9FIRM|nr:hypothetical protein P378_11045 [Desulforamulus profundi]
MEKFLYIALLLLCPIIHLFMMRGHKHHAHQQNSPAVQGEQPVTKPEQKI